MIGSQILKHEPSFENHDASLILAQSYSIGLGKSAFFLASLLSVRLFLVTFPLLPFIVAPRVVLNVRR